MRALLCLALLLVPAAGAYPQPALYFLKDGDTPPVPTLPGLLNATFPEALEPKTRLVTADPTMLPITWFSTELETHPGTLRGPLFVGLWLGHSAMAEGNITAVGMLRAPDGTFRVLGNATRDIHVEPTAPNVTSLVPPNPTDPQGSILYVAGKVLEQLLKPPVLLDLGWQELNVSEGEQLVVAFRIDPAPGQTAPIGPGATIQYDSQLQPSFVYAPWYEPDPPRPSPTTRPTGTATPPRGSPTTLGPSGTPDDSKDSPGVAALVVLAAFVALAMRRRR